MFDSTDQFLEAIRLSGLTPPPAIEAGKFYRFPGMNKGASNSAGWCTLFEDRQGGCFGDWSCGLVETWHAQRSNALPDKQRADFAQQLKTARSQAATALQVRHLDAANRATLIWNDSHPAPSNHPYLIRKMIQPYSARTRNKTLVLPVMNHSGDLNSLQFIAADGAKRLLGGGRKQGCFIPVAGDSSKPNRIIICEGWATGCTLAEDEPAALVLAAIDAGNLESVSLSARRQWPTAELIIAGDDDRQTLGNPGATKARNAAIVAGALLALPQWPEGSLVELSDFNDLSVWLAGGAA